MLESHQVNWPLTLIYLVIFASFTAFYAKSQGKNPYLWFIMGALFGIFAPLILLCIVAWDKSQGKNNNEPTMSVSEPDPSLLKNETPPPTPTLEQLKIKEEEDKLWYYIDQNHQQIGPVSIVALRELWNSGRLELTSYVWSEGMADWIKVDNLPELKQVLNRHSA